MPCREDVRTVRTVAARGAIALLYAVPWYIRSSVYSYEKLLAGHTINAMGYQSYKVIMPQANIRNQTRLRSLSPKEGNEVLWKTYRKSGNKKVCHSDQRSGIFAGQANIRSTDLHSSQVRESLIEDANQFLWAQPLPALKRDRLVVSDLARCRRVYVALYAEWWDYMWRECWRYWYIEEAWSLQKIPLEPWGLSLVGGFGWCSS